MFKIYIDEEKNKETEKSYIFISENSKIVLIFIGGELKRICTFTMLTAVIDSYKEIYDFDVILSMYLKFNEIIKKLKDEIEINYSKKEEYAEAINDLIEYFKGLNNNV